MNPSAFASHSADHQTAAVTNNSPTSPKRVVVALVGNPNTGKSSLFNALSGLRQRIGNYPGVTVEKKVGSFTSGDVSFVLIDLPGTYSLAPRSPDEMITIDILLGQQDASERPDIILNIVDASNLERNLYLTTQLLELGKPVILALNMMDVAANKGLQLDVVRLSKHLGIPVVPMQAHKKMGVPELQRCLADASQQASPHDYPSFPEAFRAEVDQWHARLNQHPAVSHQGWPKVLVQRLLIDRGGTTEERFRQHFGAEGQAQLEEARNRLLATQCPVPQIEARVRYGWIKDRLRDCLQRQTEHKATWTSRIDALLMHNVWGTLVFLSVFFLMFMGLFVGARPFMKLIEAGIAGMASMVTQSLEPGMLRNLLISGVLEGVGSVLIFLPQIMILFAFIAILEDCGYMARAAFLMDKIMARCGLGGKSFIPLLSSFACAIPGIMSTRVIENRRDRLATILIAPLMSCSARLPLYVLLSWAFFEGMGWWVPAVVIFCMYLVGLIAAPLVAFLLKKTLLRGEKPLFMLEMPAYQWPAIKLVIHRMFERGWAFVRRAATLILASMIVVWALLYFPCTDAQGRRYDLKLAELKSEIDELQKWANSDADQAKRLQQLEHEQKRLLQEWRTQSYLGRFGQWIEPAVRPLGWDWRIGTATLASFPAREIVVGTLGIIYDEGEVDVEDEAARQALTARLQSSKYDRNSPLAGRPVFTIPVALSLMVFFALCCQCVSTLVVIKRETNSWRWPLFTFTYMTGLAYLGAMVTYQVGCLF